MVCFLVQPQSLGTFSGTSNSLVEWSPTTVQFLVSDAETKEWTLPSPPPSSGLSGKGKDGCCNEEKRSVEHLMSYSAGFFSVSIILSQIQTDNSC